jgi:G8 domain/Right handed beta helix region/Peptidase inhibitor family I36
MKTCVGVLTCLFCLGGVAYAQPFPDLCASPSITATANGNWSATSTWTPARVPTAADVVSIPAGRSVTYDQVSNAAITCVDVSGTLTFVTTSDTRLTTGTLLIPNGGTLQIGPEPAAYRAEIVITEQPLDTTGVDPEQYGTGVLIAGTVSIAGAPKTPTFTRLTTEPIAGATTLMLSETPTGWQVGDRLVLPDTRQLLGGPGGDDDPYVWKGEVLTIASLSGNTVTLTAPLAYTHQGARNAEEVLEILPHVGNLTRNVEIKSANPSGLRGHVLATERAVVDIRHAAFLGLGRTTIDPEDSTAFDNVGNVTHIGTNQVGRYALHMHHLIGPNSPPPNGHQFTLIGNVVEDTTKWGLAVHDSHFGLIQDNIIYNVKGAAVVTEDGSETQNVFDHNFAVRGKGQGGREAWGKEGVGFWFRGADNIVTNNVAANFRSDQYDAAYGFKYFLTYFDDDVRTPKGPGLDPMVNANVTIQNPNAIAIRKFENNEAYGAMESGLTFWWIGAKNNDRQVGTPESVIKNFTVWHVYNRGVYHYQAYNLTVDGLVVRGSYYEQGAVGLCCQTGVDFGDYYGDTITYKNFNIQNRTYGFGGSILSGGTITKIQDGYLKNQVNLGLGTMYNIAIDANILTERHYVVRNVRIEQLPEKDRTVPLIKIGMGYSGIDGRTHNFVLSDILEVYDYNGVPGDDFRVYYTQQDPNYGPVPQTSPLNPDGVTHRWIGVPVDGLTNAQAWSMYGKAIAGEIAPCNTTRPEVVGGFACPLSTPPPLDPVRFYEHIDYAGNSFGASSDVSFVGWTWNDQISSVHVPPGRTVTLYEHIDFTGQSLTLTHEDNGTDLRNYPGPGTDGTWNDAVSSIKIQ